MQLVIIGTGLIGGSFGLAARRQGLFERVVGIDPDPDRRSEALSLGIVDAVAESVPGDADAVLLAGPSQTIGAWVVRLADHPGVIFDAGSVKGAILAEVREQLGRIPARFVPCHPLAGSEESGPGAADGALFRDASVLLTPVAETDPAACRQVEAWWQRVGARVTRLGADEHDGILARTSHLPHLLAFAYLRLVADGHLVHSAGGFRDFTRIGAADASVWAPIFRLNRPALMAALDDLEAELAEARALLDVGDQAGLAAFIESAAERRRRRPGPATRRPTS
jgi:prephenate dehydrogenase